MLTDNKIPVILEPAEDDVYKVVAEICMLAIQNSLSVVANDMKHIKWLEGNSVRTGALFPHSQFAAGIARGCAILWQFASISSRPYLACCLGVVNEQRRHKLIGPVTRELTLFYIKGSVAFVSRPV